MFAQLRDVLPAKDSAVVPKKNDHRRLALPQRTQAYFPAMSVRENDICKPLAEGFLHAERSLTSGYSSVKTAPDFFLRWCLQWQRP